MTKEIKINDDNIIGINVSNNVCKVKIDNNVLSCYNDINDCVSQISLDDGGKV